MKLLLVGILLFLAMCQHTIKAQLLGLERVLDVNALIGSGNNNKGDGVQENQVKGNQKYWHNIFNLEKKDE